jgi:hypothetical protein
MGMGEEGAWRCLKHYLCPEGNPGKLEIVDILIWEGGGFVGVNICKIH